mmetsp:Transcript_10898/g.26199  ORF Transcript_10898/g.26199 Transcript_10898/m.26199 type:complete len:232 (-) Transcript_10898:839-1534(-)
MMTDALRPLFRRCRRWWQRELDQRPPSFVELQPVVDFFYESLTLFIEGLETDFEQGCVVELQATEDGFQPLVRNSVTPVQVQLAQSRVLAEAGANLFDFLVAEPVETEIQGFEASIRGQQLPDLVSVEYAIAVQVETLKVLSRWEAIAVVVSASHDRIDDGPCPRRTDAVPPQVQAFQIRIMIHPLGQLDGTGIPKEMQTQGPQVVPSEQKRHRLWEQVQGVSEIEVQMGH